MSFVHASLFTGLGGFDLAAQWMGWENLFHCEWNEFCQKVLKYHFPNSISHNDITKTDFTIYRGRVDILTGGFPCQPFSVAGKQKGTDDERHLWPEMLRAIREVQPPYIVGENVPGLVSWDGGLVFEQVQADMEAEGYEVTPFLLSACSVGAPHQRERIWFIAKHTNGTRFQTKGAEQQTTRIKQHRKLDRTFTNAESAGSGGVRNPCCEKGTRNSNELPGIKHRVSDWKNWPTETPICDGDDGLSGRLGALTFPQWRSKSIMAGGNAIVPNVALQIFKAIEKFEQVI